MPLPADMVGIVAATLTTVAFVPQAVKTWRSRHARDLSLGMFSLFTAGVLCWLLYGVLIGSWPIIIANAVTAGLAGSILFFKLRYG
ncbi:SemiSWEET transporter [Thiofaba sp. EF100]|jgi:MtN3 and saliva related transmembrane protein|uniref:SemiSWEET transporter n=1 Tax=Thiofaba sp. EF100 TaxID=3121274 RepID=UPI003221D637